MSSKLRYFAEQLRILFPNITFRIGTIRSSKTFECIRLFFKFCHIQNYDHRLYYPAPLLSYFMIIVDPRMSLCDFLGICDREFYGKYMV